MKTEGDFKLDGVTLSAGGGLLHRSRMIRTTLRIALKSPSRRSVKLVAFFQVLVRDWRAAPGVGSYNRSRVIRATLQIALKSPLRQSIKLVAFF